MHRFTFLFLALATAGFAVADGPEPAPAPVPAPQPADITTAASPTEFLNRNLPRWLRFDGEIRFREEGFLGNRFEDGNDDMYLLQRYRLGVHVKPTEWLDFYSQLQDSRVVLTDRAAKAPPLQDSLDLRQAWVQFGRSEKDLLSLRVGRQELAFGEERLVGASNWGNTARTFDAVRLGIHRGGYSLDAFASSVVVARDHWFDEHKAGDNLHGLYGGITNWIPGGKLEPYLFWRLAPTVRGDTGTVGHDDSKTFGVRWFGKLPRAFAYNMEIVGQRGTWSTDSISAWAGYWRVEKTLTSARWTPTLRFEYNHASGDDNPTDRTHGTFEVLYPTPHDKYGLADQVGWKNLHHVGFTIEGKPRKGLLVQFKAHDRWLSSAKDGLYNASGTLLYRDLTGRSGRHIGEELDVQAVWTASPRLMLGGGLGYMFAGDFLQKVSPGHSYTFPYVMLTYRL